MTRPEADRLRHWASLPLVWLVRGYQLFLSPLLPSSCRYYPSCSAYALTALRRFGPITGSWLTIRRLGRCHPWNPGGVDHVPRRGSDGRPIRRSAWRAPQDAAAALTVDPTLWRDASRGVARQHGAGDDGTGAPAHAANR